MKTILISLLVVFQFSVYAQVKVYETKHLNIGFGTSNAGGTPTNSFMDFCVNGPLVDSNQLPVGGYIDNNTQKQNWLNPGLAAGNFSTDNVIFGLGVDGKLHMVSYAEKSTLPAMKMGISKRSRPRQKRQERAG